MLKRLRRPMLIFITSSLFLHAVFWAAVNFRPTRIKTSLAEQNVEVEIVSAPPPQQKKTDSQQIVEQKDRVNEIKDEDAKFLGAHDQKVEEEMRANNAGTLQNAAQAGKKAQAQQAPPPEQAPEETPDPNRKKDLPSLSSLTPQFNPQPSPPQETGEEGQNSEVSATDDYLKDVNAGLQTMLSTREFVYYTYYNRIKERIRQHWEPSIRTKVKMIYRQGRTIASTKDHITQVVITLNRKGELIQVDVVTPSGLQQLDDAAVEAFRAAQPFPNPPRGLIDEDGLIKIRWDFVLEANNDVLSSTKYAKGTGDENHSTRGL